MTSGAGRLEPVQASRAARNPVRPEQHTSPRATRSGARADSGDLKTSPMPPVSVIVPARDAAATLARALESVLAQDYAGGFEVIVADGSEGAETGALVRRRFPRVRVVPNPGREIACGLNAALRAARHPVIARCDARALLPEGYLTRAVATLLRTAAANVGGRQNPVGFSFFERAVALATSTPLGAGGARHRIGGAEGPVDTVFLGVFRREALDAAGAFDESLLRNEDYELNWRLRAGGGTVWFDPALVVDYRPRGSLRALARQYFDYGRWKRVVLGRHPRSLRLRQAAAPLLLAALAASAALAVAGGLAGGAGPGTLLMGAAAVCPAGYGLLLIGASAAIGLRRRCAAAVLLPVVAATIHLAWAAGFFAGAPGGAGGKRR